MSLYPEHEKMRRISGQSQSIGDFIEWLHSQGLGLGRWQEVEGYRNEQFVPALEGISSLLAKYFDIDLDVIEAEKRQMLDALAPHPTPEKAGRVRWCDCADAPWDDARCQEGECLESWRDAEEAGR